MKKPYCAWVLALYIDINIYEDLYHISAIHLIKRAQAWWNVCITHRTHELSVFMLFRATPVWPSMEE